MNLSAWTPGQRIELREDRLFREIFDTASATTETGARPRNLVNRNDLVQTVPYVNGVKTGYTIDAGNVLVGSAKQGGVQPDIIRFGG